RAWRVARARCWNAASGGIFLHVGMKPARYYILPASQGRSRGKARRGGPFLVRMQSDYSTDFSSLPISDGLRVVRIPHASITSSLASAVSAPPEMRAPA